MGPKETVYKKEYALELIRIAEGDLKTVKQLKKLSDYRKENLCFLAQQSIEKSLKAVLCWHRIPYSYTHDLNALVAKMPKGVSPPQDYDLGTLNDYATVRRYEEGPYELRDEDIDEVDKVTDSIFKWASKEVGK